MGSPAAHIYCTRERIGVSHRLQSFWEGSMKKLFNILKEKLAPLSGKLQSLKSILPQKKPHSEKYYKRIAFLNKYSLIFHFLLACLLILAVETISRRDFVSAITFISNHTLAFLYNALIIFASLSLVYLTKYRTQMRILISGLWIFLGTVNGLILSNRRNGKRSDEIDEF